MYRRSLWILITLLAHQTFAADSDYNILNTDGSYDFRYDNPDSYHESHANRNNVVNGAFGGRNPATGSIDRTQYTAGPRGFRPKGKNVVRKYDLSQREVRPIGNKDDPYYDPYEDPSYNFQFNTGVYNRKEGANRFGDVTGSYTYLDDVGDKHEVEYIAGKNTGFHVKTPYPDSYPNLYRTLYFKDPRKPYMRGRSFIQRGIDGSYRFAAIGPDQRRTEVSDSVGNVRGSYTYKDEKGVQHSVHYIAGPNIGYRVLKNVKGPHLPTLFPFNSQDIISPDFYEGKESDSDVFTQAASTYVTPKPSKDGGDYALDNSNQIDKTTTKPITSDSSIARPTRPPQNLFDNKGDEDEEELFDDLFNSGVRPAPGRPTPIKPSTYKPPVLPMRQPVRPTQIPITTRPFDSKEKPQSSLPGGKPVTAVGGAVNNNIFSTKPSIPGQNVFGTKPSASREDIFSTKPTLSGGGAFDIGLSETGSASDIFDSASPAAFGTRPTFTGGPFSQRPRPPKPTDAGGPVLQFDLTGAGEDDRYHTIITNWGDTVFTAPPGVPVRAHVQSIGLIPLYPRPPSPSEQYKAETTSFDEADIEVAANRYSNVASTSSTVTTTIPATSSTISTTTQSTETTTSTGMTTTQLPETTTSS